MTILNVNVEDVWCWLKENWRFIVGSGLFASIIIGIATAIFKIMKWIPKMLRIRKVKKYVKDKINKHISEFSNLSSEMKRVSSPDLTFYPMELVSELRETEDIVNRALIQLFRKKVIDFHYGSYSYRIKVNAD